MRSKLFVCLTLLIVILFGANAGSYRITIENAEDVSVSDSMVVLSGNVRLAFKSDGDQEGSQQERGLKASKVTVDTEDKTLEAVGDVVLQDGDDSFKGECVVFNWDNLDVVVYGGTSSSGRKNSSGDSIEFHAVGEKISYAGGEKVVMFSNGMISTSDSDDPNWSIKASKLGLLESDMVFRNATIRIGRVPVMWVPMFFYPGTTMTFNPSMGLSSSRGMFLNTTYELWGKYPGLGTGGDSSSSDASAFLSFMASDESRTSKDGLFYTSTAKEGEKSAIEKWAESSSSYMAVMADVYQKNGLALSFDTSDTFGKNKNNVTAKGVVAFDPSLTGFKTGKSPRFRSAVDFSAKLKGSNNSFTLSMPYYTDPYVRSVYFNRNTVFGLDSVLGSYQNFPTTYSSTDSSFSWNFDSDASYKIGKFNFKLSSLKGSVNWSWKNENRYEVTDATLPYLSFSSDGTLLDLEGSKKTMKVANRYKSALAREFGTRLEELESEASSEISESEETVKMPVLFLAGPDFKKDGDVSFSASHLKFTYSVNEVLSDTFTKKFKPNTFTSDTSGDLGFSARLPWDSLLVTGTTSNKLSYSKKAETSTSKGSIKKTYTLDQALSASIPIAGVSYVIKGNIIKLSETDDEVKTDNRFKWSSDYVSTHYIEVSRKVGNFTFSYHENLKPVAESIIPTVSWADSGFSASVSNTFYLGDSFLKKGKAQVSTGYSGSVFTFSMVNKYDFEKSGWSGFTTSQKSSLKLCDKVLGISESIEMKDRFKIDSLKLSVGAYDNTASISFQGEDIKPDAFSLDSNIKVNPLYFWKNRVGVSSTLKSKLVYDFDNRYATAFSVDFSLLFSVYRFLDISLSVQSSNTSFYRYYEDDRFKVGLLTADLLRSFNFFNRQDRLNTGFNMTGLSLKAVHYMEDWNLYCDVSEKIVTSGGKSYWNPEISVYIKWKAIPELKVDNKWTNSGWEK